MGVTAPVIRVGDRTSHGGAVIEGYLQGQYEVYGIAGAGLGHAVSCPLHPGIQRIAEGESSFNVYGRPVALEGMSTTCGATLIASQQNAKVERRSVTGIADSADFYQDTETGQWHEGADPGPHDEQFILINRQSKEPLANIRYVIETASGRVFEGSTDASGKTRRVATGNSSQILTLRLRRGGAND